MGDGREGGGPWRSCSRVLATLLVLGASFGGFGGCGEEESASSDGDPCEPGARRDCDCDELHSGTQLCRGDGLDYLSCDCTTAAAGGAGGVGGSQDAGAGQCVEEADACRRSGDCCGFPDAACVATSVTPAGNAAPEGGASLGEPNADEDASSGLCASTCDANAKCVSGCCAVLDDYSGACTAARLCGDGSCRENGFSCDDSADCCDFDEESPGSYCLDLERGGPGVCAARCDDDGDCESECCLPLANGDSACFPTEDC